MGVFGTMSAASVQIRKQLDIFDSVLNKWASIKVGLNKSALISPSNVRGSGTSSGSVIEIASNRFLLTKSH